MGLGHKTTVRVPIGGRPIDTVQLVEPARVYADKQYTHLLGANGWVPGYTPPPPVPPPSGEHPEFDKNVALLRGNGTLLMEWSGRTVRKVADSNGQGADPFNNGAALGTTPSNPFQGGNGSCSWNGGDAECFPMFDGTYEEMGPLGGEAQKVNPFEDLSPCTVTSGSALEIPGDRRAQLPVGRRIAVWSGGGGAVKNRKGEVQTVSYDGPSDTTFITHNASSVSVGDAPHVIRYLRPGAMNEPGARYYSAAYSTAHDACVTKFNNDQGSSQTQVLSGDLGFNSAEYSGALWSFQFEIAVRASHFFTPITSTSRKLFRMYRPKVQWHQDDRLCDVRGFLIDPDFFEILPALMGNGAAYYAWPTTHWRIMRADADVFFRQTQTMYMDRMEVKVRRLSDNQVVHEYTDFGRYNISSTTFQFTEGNTPDRSGGPQDQRYVVGKNSGARAQMCQGRRVDTGAWTTGDAAGESGLYSVTGTFQPGELCDLYDYDTSNGNQLGLLYDSVFRITNTPAPEVPATAWRRTSFAGHSTSHKPTTPGLLVGLPIEPTGEIMIRNIICASEPIVDDGLVPAP